jgi:hypothetical protein
MKCPASRRAFSFPPFDFSLRFTCALRLMRRAAQTPD